MASESVRALNEKLASENLFKAKAVGETQVSLLLFPTFRHRVARVPHSNSVRPRRTRSNADDVNNGNAHITRCKREVQMSR